MSEQIAVNIGGKNYYLSGTAASLVSQMITYGLSESEAELVMEGAYAEYADHRSPEYVFGTYEHVKWYHGYEIVYFRQYPYRKFMVLGVPGEEQFWQAPVLPTLERAEKKIIEIETREDWGYGTVPETDVDVNEMNAEDFAQLQVGTVALGELETAEEAEAGYIEQLALVLAELELLKTKTADDIPEKLDEYQLETERLLRVQAETEEEYEKLLALQKTGYEEVISDTLEDLEGVREDLKDVQAQADANLVAANELQDEMTEAFEAQEEALKAAQSSSGQGMFAGAGQIVTGITVIVALVVVISVIGMVKG